MVRSHAKFKITGKVTIYKYPSNIIKSYHDHILIGESRAFPCVHYARCKERGWIIDEGDNLIVNAGLNQLILLLNGSSTTAFTFCGVGSGNIVVAPTDIDLTTPIVRIAVTTPYQNANVGHWDTFFNSATGNGTWMETALFSAISAGIMLCKKLITSFPKTTSNTATVAWTITVTAI